MVAHSLKEALEVRKNPEYIPYTGGTDLMVWADENAQYLFLHKVPEMKQIVEDNEYIRIGASCTFSEIIENPLTPKILQEACLNIAAPAIRNVGSIGGNIGNGSAKADSALICMATDSKLRLASATKERIVPIREMEILPDELIVEVLMPKQGIDNYYYQKVGGRKALAISRVSFAGVIDISPEGIVRNCSVAFGAVSNKILCFSEIDEMLIGKSVQEAGNLKEAYLAAYDKAIVPIRGRVGIEYRKDVCMKLLRDFFESKLGGENL